MLERVDENTIMVVPTFGVTYTGAYEPVLVLARALDKLQEDTGLDVDIHVTGPSVRSSPPSVRPTCCGTSGIPGSSRSAPRVTSFGLAPLGVGWVLWRDTADLPDDLVSST